MARSKKYVTFKGDNGKFGVEQGNAVLYDAEFTEKIAKRIAELENTAKSPRDWYETADILEAEGFPYKDIYGHPRPKKQKRTISAD